jgi:hypothetical protein
LAAPLPHLLSLPDGVEQLNNVQQNQNSNDTQTYNNRVHVSPLTFGKPNSESPEHDLPLLTTPASNGKLPAEVGGGFQCFVKSAQNYT